MSAEELGKGQPSPWWSEESGQEGREAVTQLGLPSSRVPGMKVSRGSGLRKGGLGVARQEFISGWNNGHELCMVNHLLSPFLVLVRAPLPLRLSWPGHLQSWTRAAAAPIPSGLLLCGGGTAGQKPVCFEDLSLGGGGQMQRMLELCWILPHWSVIRKAMVTLPGPGVVPAIGHKKHYTDCVQCLLNE
jgi:hypothetical protein